MYDGLSLKCAKPKKLLRSLSSMTRTSRKRRISGQDRRIKGGLRAVFGYMTIERGGTRGGWFSFLMYICTGNFSHSYVNGRTDVPFYSVNLNLNTFYMDVSRSVVEIR